MTAPRAGVPGMTDLRGAVLDNVGSTATQMKGSAGAQHCQGGHPREERREEGATKLLWSPRTRSSGPQRHPRGAHRGDGATKGRESPELGPVGRSGYPITPTIGTVESSVTPRRFAHPRKTFPTRRPRATRASAAAPVRAIGCAWAAATRRSSALRPHAVAPAARGRGRRRAQPPAR